VAERSFRLPVISLFVLTLVLVAPRSVWGNTFNVPSGDVAGLIAAIETANSNDEADTINLAASSAYNLSAVYGTCVPTEEIGCPGPNGLPVITSAIVIEGNDSIIARSGTDKFRLFEVGDGGALTLNDLTLTGGDMTGVGSGGAIQATASSATLTLNHCTVSSNSAIEGGGISHQGNSSTLTLIRTRVLDNVVTSDVSLVVGGGVGASSRNGTMTLIDTTIDGNQAVATGPMNGAHGGGIAIEGVVTVTMIRSTISNNVVSASGNTASGGGFDDEGGSSVSMLNSTISGNQVRGMADPGLFGGATARGGGFESGGGGAATLNNVTITNNTVAHPDPDGAQGAGIDNPTADNLLVSEVFLRNTIVAGNGAAPASPDCFGPVTSQGHNLIGNANGCAIMFLGSDIAGESVGLGLLAANGGPTQTHALLPGSPAIDAGDPGTPGTGGTACEATDQRGVARPMAGERGGMALCDIGAFEAPAPCLGDCDDRGMVTVDEILILVNIALGNAALSVCPAGDGNTDGQVTVDEILTAVNNALNGCQGR
jgi:hypothetical protein